MMKGLSHHLNKNHEPFFMNKSEEDERREMKKISPHPLFKNVNKDPNHANVRVKKATISPNAPWATKLSESCPSSIINPCGSPW